MPNMPETTIAMLAGLLTPDAGEACLDGHSIRTEPEAAKAALGLTTDPFAAGTATGIS